MTGATTFVCATCGTVFPAGDAPPDACPICQDVRQYVPETGQRWTTPVELGSRHRNVVERLEPHLYAIRSEPRLAIGQRALLLQTPSGNVLWDCITLLDRSTVEAVRALGGVSAIAISHPHYYSAQRAWSEAFDAPVHLHGADGDWVVDRHPRLHPWEGEQLRLVEGVTLLRAGGHFPGGQLVRYLFPSGK